MHQGRWLYGEELQALNEQKAKERARLHRTQQMLDEERAIARADRSQHTVHHVIDAEGVTNTARLLNNRKRNVVAVDCEGILGLWRKPDSFQGKLVLVQVCMENEVFLYDLAKLESAGKVALDKAMSLLKTLLESKTILKLMWDCRCDSDALRHQLGIELSCVLDLQLCAIALNSPHQRPCLTASDKGDAFHEAWGSQPLSQEHIRYAVLDVKIISAKASLFNALGNSRPAKTKQQTRFGTWQEIVLSHSAHAAKVGSLEYPPHEKWHSLSNSPRFVDKSKRGKPLPKWEIDFPSDQGTAKQIANRLDRYSAVCYFQK
jgi:hypothetical protein